MFFQTFVQTPNTCTSAHVKHKSSTLILCSVPYVQTRERERERERERDPVIVHTNIKRLKWNRVRSRRRVGQSPVESCERPRHQYTRWQQCEQMVSSVAWACNKINKQIIVTAIEITKRIRFADVRLSEVWFSAMSQALVGGRRRSNLLGWGGNGWQSTFNFFNYYLFLINYLGNECARIVSHCYVNT